MSELSQKLELAKKLAGKRKVSRRDFIQLALAAGFTAATADTMFIKAVRAEPKKGGHYIQSLTGGASSDVQIICDAFAANNHKPGLILQQTFQRRSIGIANLEGKGRGVDFYKFVAGVQDHHTQAPKHLEPCHAKTCDCR
jgi:hypothetical protein